MLTEERVAALKAKHQALDDRIQQEEQRPHPDENMLHQLKREKLRIKDEMSGIAAH